MAKHMFYSQFFWKVKPENITGLLLASLHQPDICYIKRDSHSCLVQANKNKTKQRTKKIDPDFLHSSNHCNNNWSRIIICFSFYQKCSCAFLLPKKTIHASAHSNNMREHPDGNQMDKQDEMKNQSTDISQTSAAEQGILLSFSHSSSFL